MTPAGSIQPLAKSVANGALFFLYIMRRKDNRYLRTTFMVFARVRSRLGISLSLDAGQRQR